MKFLPTQIKWFDPYECSSASFQYVLVATHKHSHRDWEINFGSIYPIENYTDYQIKIGDRIIDRSEVLAIGMFSQYGRLE